MNKLQTTMVALVFLATAGIVQAETGTSASVNVAAEATVTTGTGTDGGRMHKPMMIGGKVEKRLDATREKASTTRANLEERKENMRERMEEKKDEMKERMEERRDEMKERRVDIAKKHLKMVFHRLEAAIERLTKIADRIESRIAKLDASGQDTSKAEASLADARTKIAKAKIDLDAAKTSLLASFNATTTVEVSASSTPAENAYILKIKSAMKSIEESLRAAHKSLVEAIRVIKGLRAPKEVSATTTAATTVE